MSNHRLGEPSFSRACCGVGFGVAECQTTALESRLFRERVAVLDSELLNVKPPPWGTIFWKGRCVAG